MTDRCFLGLWEDLCGHFGYKAADNVRIISVYKNAAEHVSDDSRMKLFELVLTECERFPGLGRFKDLCEGFLPKNPVSRYKNDQKCWYCLDYGFIYINETCTSYSCPRCSMGKKFIRQNYMTYEEKFGREALEELGEENRNHKPVPIEVSKAKFIENISKWNCRL